MNRKQFLGIAFVVVGLIFAFLGYRSTQASGMEKIKREVTRNHEHVERTRKYLMAGVACVVIGGGLVVFFRKKHK
jgi:drug/metabolite transporter (DMT)-like permease